MTRTEFNEYVRLTNRKLFSIAFRLLHNQEEAEDAVQEVFIKLWKLGTKLDEYKSIDALATTMLKNHCIDQIRKQKNFKISDDLNNEAGLISSSSPYDQIVDAESAEIIHNLINKLPDLYRIAIEMRDIEGMSYDEIVEKTGQNINTLRVTLSRARSMIRDDYKKQFDEKKRTEQFTPKVL